MDHSTSAKTFDIYEVIARIRHHPSIYIGSRSITALLVFLEGCFYAAELLSIERSEQPRFRGFDNWVAKRFGWYESTAGWANIILKESGENDSKALDLFFELIDEYRQGASDERPEK